VEALVRAMGHKSDGQIRFILPFELFIAENI